MCFSVMAQSELWTTDVIDFSLDFIVLNYILQLVYGLLS